MIYIHKIWSGLRDSTFSGFGTRFGTKPACDVQTDRRTDTQTHDDSIYRASISSIASLGQNECNPWCNHINQNLKLPGSMNYNCVK